MLHDLAGKYALQGLRLVIVSVDEPEDYAKLESFAASFGFSAPIWVAAPPLDDFKKALAENWKGNIPVTFLYDSKGMRRYFWDGPIEESEITPVIEQFLGGKPVQGETHYALLPGVTGDQH